MPRRRFRVKPDGLFAPDLLIRVLIAVAGVEDILVAAIGVDVGVDEQVQRRDIVAPGGSPAKGAVQFVDRLPAMQVQRLGDGRD